MNKEIIQTEKAPKAIGPYSQAVKYGNLLFISGQIAIDPSTGKLVKDSLEVECRQVMKNLEAILTAAGTGFNAVVKSSIFLKEMSFFSSVNEIYASYLSAPYPARETVAVKTLPMDVSVEISMIASV